MKRLVTLVLLLGGCADKETYEVFAVEFARSQSVPVSRLVREADAGATVDMSWYFFVARSKKRTLIIDAGTPSLVTDERRRREWRIGEADRPERRLALLGIGRGDVSEALVTHRHWDHVDGLTAFPKARVWVHERERAGLPKGLGKERVQTFAADRSLLGGIRARVAGRHTAGHTAYVVPCERGPVVVGGDAAYLFDNIEQRRPITQTKAPNENVSDVQALAKEFGRVIPGHDPAVFDRFPLEMEGIAKVCP